MPFRFHAKNLFVTYPQADGLTKERLQHFYEELGCSSYTISRELHQTGDVHFHGLIQWATPFDTRDERRFDVDGRHPNIQRCRKVRDVWRYVTKDGDYISNRAEPDESNSNKFAALANADTVETFWSIAKEECPRNYVVDHERLEYFANKKFKAEKKIYEPSYTNFNIPDEVSEWVINEYPKVSDAPLGPAAGYRPDGLLFLLWMLVYVINL